MRCRRYAWVAVLMLLLAVLACPAAAGDCSPYVNDMTINEVYAHGSAAWVETRLLDGTVPATVYRTWSLKLCEDNKGCTSYPLADAVILFPDDFPNHLVVEVDKAYINLQKNGGMDAVLQDAADQCIDYLSVNAFSDQQPACAGLLYPTAIDGLSSSRKGIYRDADGTGAWYELEAPGRPGEPTQGKSNTGAEGQVDHYRIEHPADGLTCQGSDITIRACRDAGCSDFYEEIVEGTLLPGGSRLSFTGGNATVRLRHNEPGVVTLGLTAANPAPVNGIRCFVGGVEGRCDMVFHESGFLLTVPDLTSCQAPAAASIQAVRTDLATQACVAHDGFARQSKEVFFWSEYLQPATGTRPLRVDGSAVAAASPGTPVTLTFNANARSSFNVAYDDAGQLRLQALYLGSGEEAGLVMTGSDSLVAAPHHLRVRATTDSDGTIPLDNATPNGEPHWPAGEDFQVEVAGVCADGTVTPNFAAATTLTAIAADPALVVPDPFSGGPFTAGDYSEGLVTGAASYREVGTVTLQAVAADYLESGIDVIGASDPVGRFTPHHFAVALNEPRFASGCGGGYTYLGQSFDFAVAPVITVTAQNRQNGTTGNYTGDWWKISRDSLNGRLYSAAEGTLDPSGLPEEDPTISDLGGGIGLLTFAAGDGLLFERSAPTAPFEAEISLEINVVDEDDIACADNPVRFGEATAGNGIAFDAAKTMRWGRLALSNAYGSELVPLAMPLRAEYFDGGSFVTNDADICTSLALSQLTLSNTSGTVSADQPMAVGAGSTVASLLDPLVNGDAGLTFSAPGAEGYVDVAAGLALLPWLRYDWDGDGSHDDDPAARATFGIYRSRPSLIYRRETWR